MATNNVINRKSSELTVDPGASVDSFVQFDINGTGEFRIGIDDTDDSFKISQGSALGSSDTFVMTAAGERTMPLQPAFEARTTSTKTNVSGNNTLYTIIFDTEDFDQNSDFNTGTGIFTAPITGRYLLCASNCMYIDATGGDQQHADIVTSNRSHFLMFYPTRNKVANYSGENDYLSHSASVICDMDAADTAYVMFVSGDNAKADDIIADGSTSTNFSGVLIC
jgi:hypothetical protein